MNPKRRCVASLRGATAKQQPPFPLAPHPASHLTFASPASPHAVPLLPPAIYSTLFSSSPPRQLAPSHELLFRLQEQSLPAKTRDLHRVSIVTLLPCPRSALAHRKHIYFRSIPVLPHEKKDAPSVWSCFPNARLLPIRPRGSSQVDRKKTFGWERHVKREGSGCARCLCVSDQGQALRPACTSQNPKRQDCPKIDVSGFAVSWSFNPSCPRYFPSLESLAHANTDLVPGAKRG